MFISMKANHIHAINVSVSIACHWNDIQIVRFRKVFQYKRFNKQQLMRFILSVFARQGTLYSWCKKHPEKK